MPHDIDMLSDDSNEFEEDTREDADRVLDDQAGTSATHCPAGHGKAGSREIGP